MQSANLTPSFWGVRWVCVRVTHTDTHVDRSSVRHMAFLERETRGKVEGTCCHVA